MGKRSNFERREADFYPTPRAAVAPLIPHLRGIHSFAEPCAGDGALVRNLEGFGLRCVYAGDIHSGQDALALDHYGAPDCIITNPPYTRLAMHAQHFQDIAQTWLLIDYDWSATRQAAQFRYIRHAQVPRFTAEGWERLLDGTHHDEYSVLRRRVEQIDDLWG